MVMAEGETNKCEYISVWNIREIFGFSESTIWRWTKEGRFPQPVRHGKRWTRWRRADVEDFINRNETLEG